MAIGDKFLLKMNYAVNFILCSNTFIYEQVSDSAEADITSDLLAAFGDLMAPKFLQIWSNETQLSSIQAWQVASTVPPSLTLFVGDFGAVLSPACPANKNMKFRLRQDRFSTRTNGELRVAGIPESLTEGNIYTGGTILPLPHAQLAALLVGVIESPVGSAATWKLMLESNGLEAAAAGPLPQYSDVIQVEIAARVYSDRRRTSGHFQLQVPPI